MRCLRRLGDRMPFRIESRDVGPGSACYVIAEMSANHNQDYERLKHLARDMQRPVASIVREQTLQLLDQKVPNDKGGS